MQGFLAEWRGADGLCVTRFDDAYRAFDVAVCGLARHRGSFSKRQIGRNQVEVDALDVAVSVRSLTGILEALDFEPAPHEPTRDAQAFTVAHHQRIAARAHVG
jgi:hypothetical protein